MIYSDPKNVPSIWQIGDVILDRYEVKQIFTGGGMGLVYRVHHRDWNMSLAVKSPRPEFFETQQQIENFEREAETWVNLGLHPHTVSCHYVRRLGDIPRIFAEFVDAGTLADWIRTRRLYDGGKEKSLARIIDIAIQCGWGLHFAHEKGLVHKDVKPRNVLLSSDGIAKVSDFGLANARLATFESATLATHLGQSIFIPGSGLMTPEYASPEQVRGASLSQKTDIWSWAVSLLEMLLGELTWTSGLAAPAVIDELGDHLLDREIIDLLHGCFGSNACERFTSFEPILVTLIEYYTSRFGQYSRSEPQSLQLSPDEANNRAASLADLGKYDEALVELEKAILWDQSHTLATYNYSVLNHRRSYKTDEFGRDALYALLKHNPTDAITLVANALFCLERGLAFRANALYTQLVVLGGERPRQAADLEMLLKRTPACDLEQPAMYRIYEKIDFLKISSDGKHLIVQGQDGLSSYIAETGERCLTISEEYKFLQLSENNALLQKGKSVFTWNFHDAPVLLDSFRIEIPDGNYFAISNSGHRLCIFDGESLIMLDANSGETLWQTELEPDPYSDPEINDLKFSSDGQYISYVRPWFHEELQVLETESGDSVRMKHFVDNGKRIIPFGRLMLSINRERLLQVWDLEERQALGILESQDQRYLGIPSGNTDVFAFLTNGSISIQTPHLSLIATIAWWEIASDVLDSHGRPVCIASSDGRTWYVGTSNGEVVRFRLSKPQHVPVLISKPVSSENLALRKKKQMALLESAKQKLQKGNAAMALELSRQALSIQCGESTDAAQLHDKVITAGRKQTVNEVRLVFDLYRTILGGSFRLADITPDGRNGLAERTYFSRGESYEGDYFRLVNLRDGAVTKLPKVSRGLNPKLSPNRDFVVTRTTAGLNLIPTNDELRMEVQHFSKCPKNDFDVQFALNSEIISFTSNGFGLSADIWHTWERRTGAVRAFYTKTPHFRIMPDGFHAYAVTSDQVYWMHWPFKRIDRKFRMPEGFARERISTNTSIFSSDGRWGFLADDIGGFYILDTKKDYYNYEWDYIKAHEDKITHIFSGADSRFALTVADDGIKIWNNQKRQIIYSHSEIKPKWVSDDFRFIIEASGSVFEIDWLYSFDSIDGVDETAAMHIENFVLCRKAASGLIGGTWKLSEKECDVLSNELSKCGCGSLSSEYILSIVKTKFPYFLR